MRPCLEKAKKQTNKQKTQKTKKKQPKKKPQKTKNKQMKTSLGCFMCDGLFSSATEIYKS